MYPVIPLEMNQALAEGMFCLLAALGTLVSFLLNWR
jgi:hypothetical protein